MTELNWFPIFKGGTQTDSTGTKHDGSKVIEDAIKSFDLNKHQPPIVIGHPKTNSPAYGWISELKKVVENGIPVLYARAKQALPEFIDWLKKGLYKTRSASFYPDNSLRHVGFLGATPPAVKGLPNIFNDSDKCFLFEEEINVRDDKSLIDKIVNGVIDGVKGIFDFSATTAEKDAQTARSKQYGIAVKQNNSNVTKPGQWANLADVDWLDPVNYRYPMPDASHIRNAAARWAQVKPGDYSTAEVVVIDKRLDDAEKKAKIGKYKNGGSNMTEKFEFTEEELQAKIDLAVGEATKKVTDEVAKKERKKVESEFAEKQKTAELETEKKGIVSFVEALKKEGKLIPAWEDAGLVNFMQSLNDGTEVEFAEGKKTSKVEWFKNFLSGMEKVIEFKEIADNKNRKSNKKSEFDGEPVDEDRLELNNKVRAFMEKSKEGGKNISYSEALQIVLEMEE